MLQMLPIANVSDLTSFTFWGCIQPCICLKTMFLFFGACNLKAILQESKHIQHSYFSTLSYLKDLTDYESFDQDFLYIVFYYLCCSSKKDTVFNIFLVLVLQCFTTRRSCTVPCKEVEIPENLSFAPDSATTGNKYFSNIYNQNTQHG